MCARELRSERSLSIWRDELLGLSACPFDVGPSVLFVAYNAAAELGCFCALGWEMPDNVLDLAQEHKLSINYGKFAKRAVGWGLGDALACRRAAHAMAAEKPHMVQMILAGGDYTAAQRQSILAYCMSDVVALSTLYEIMIASPEMDLPRAVGLRGRYMKAVARMEHNGIPFDVSTFHEFRTCLPRVQLSVVAELDKQLNVYEANGSFSNEKFVRFLGREGIEWQRTKTGKPYLDSDYVEKRAKGGNPKLLLLHQVRGLQTQMRAITGQKGTKSLSPSSDGYIRAPLWAFGTATGRNAPSSSDFMFGPSAWIRGLIKPKPGMALAYVDWSQQEFAIAAGLSGDAEMQAAYASGDVYVYLAKQSGMIPHDASRAEIEDNEAWSQARAACKIITLGVSYGKGVASIAHDDGLPYETALAVWQRHRSTYRVFWSWTDRVVQTALQQDDAISTRWGWRQKVNRDTSNLSLQNFPMQAGGAHAMQFAAIEATEVGLQICCPVHDAFLIEATLERIDADVLQLQEMMVRAGRRVAGIDIRTDVEIVRFPDRYMDKRGKVAWAAITGRIADLKSREF